MRPSEIIYCTWGKNLCNITRRFQCFRNPRFSQKRAISEKRKKAIKITSSPENSLTRSPKGKYHQLALSKKQKRKRKKHVKSETIIMKHNNYPSLHSVFEWKKQNEIKVIFARRSICVNQEKKSIYYGKWQKCRNSRNFTPNSNT